MTDERLSTGIDGLDEVLSGGLIPERGYMVLGRPGTGKSLLCLEYLRAGVERGETALCINLEESEEDIRRNAASVGIDLEEVEFLDLTPSSELFTADRSYDVFEPGEVELSETTDRITERVEELSPDRVVVDPLTQIHYLAADRHQFRQQVLALTRYFGQAGTTLLFTAGDTAGGAEDLQFMADGVIELSEAPTGRTVAVPKFRGSDSRGGEHTLQIGASGLVVYPELGSNSRDAEFTGEPISSGVPALDEQLHGGLERGTVTVVAGPTGVGKTTTSTQFAKEAAGRGERTAVYMFEETESTFRNRSEAVNIPVGRMMERGTLTVEEIEALEQSPQEFAHGVRSDVEDDGTQIVMIDGLAGYELSLRGESDDLRRRLHRLCRYLKDEGVTVILIDEVDTVTGDFRATQSGVSYLADNILFLRHLEIRGELRKVIGVLKKRTSDYERTLREFEITEHGIVIGDPLTDLRGILQGTPEWAGGTDGPGAGPDG